MKDFIFRQDWTEVKNRYKKWWNREKTDRPFFYMWVNEQSGDINQSKNISLNDKWLNIEGILDRLDVKLKSSHFLAEGYPCTSACLGPGSLATFLGSEPAFDFDTVWYNHCISDITKATIKLNKDSKWWKWTEAFTKRAVERSNGRYLVEMPDLIENADILASLLGAEPLIYNMYDEPESIHRLQKELVSAWGEAFDSLYEIIKDDEGGMSYGDYGTWAPGKVSKVQCDFSAMISVNTFEEFIFPYFREQCEKIDYPVYHLDGPSSIQHLDLVLSIKNIKAIQWQPGASTGVPVASDPCWDYLYRKIQDAGKSILTLLPTQTDEDVKKLEAFIKRNGKEGILILSEPHPTSLKHAYELIDKSINW